MTTAPVSDVDYFDDHLYDELVELGHLVREDTRPSHAELRGEAETALYREARLLDQRCFTDWLSLFTDDCVYWVPFDAGLTDPREHLSYTLDDRRRLEDRIARLGTGWAHSQTPSSRTCRVVSNVEAWPLDDGGRWVRADLVIWEQRRHVVSAYPASLHEQLRPDGDRWRIHRRVVRLLASDSALGNVSFVL